MAWSARTISNKQHLRLSGDEAGLVGYWRCDEGTGTELGDQSPSAISGPVTGASWIEDRPPVRERRAAKVVITTINYDGAVKRTEADEYVELRNEGEREANLSGWTLGADDEGQTFTFPQQAKLASGQVIRVYTNEVHLDSGGYSYAIKRSIWNNRGDVGRLQDATGAEVSTFAYGDATSD